MPPGSRPLPVSVPSPDVVVAPALVPCPSGSALACRRRRAGSCPLPVSVRPRLPSSLPPSPPPLPSRRRPRHPVNLCGTKPSLPPPPLPSISCFLGEVPFHIQRNELPISLKKKSVIFIIYGTTFKKNESGQDFQRGQIWNDRSQKQKKNYGSHPVSK